MSREKEVKIRNAAKKYRDLLHKLSCDFKRGLQPLRSYSERMRFYDLYYKRWYSLLENASSIDPYPDFNKDIAKFFKYPKEKSIFLSSPSNSEILYFSKNFKKVFFISLPYREADFPSNVVQIKYDKKFNPIIGESLLNNIDCAFSHAVVEHIHPDDIGIHFKQIFSLLKKQGEYFFICPSSIRIEKDDCSLDKDKNIAANHHIGRYNYNDIVVIASKCGFTSFYKPILNPLILNYFYKYKFSWFYEFCKRFGNHIPDFLLSAIALNSLYIKMIK